LRSYFGNIAYTFREKYSISASSRFDGTNYFGVKTNDKTVPLWSSGLKWDISKEKFYKFNQLPTLSFHITYGYSGNLDRNTTAITTFQYYNNALYTGLPYAGISNIGNPQLRWEKSGQLNVGVNVGTKNNRIAAIVEYFKKKGDDLIGPSLIDPTTGVNLLKGNFAGMETNGIDFQIGWTNNDNIVKWTASFNFNYAKEKVTRWDFPNSPLGYLSASIAVTPEVGKPLYGFYSYKWAGLDPQTGDPRFYISDTISKNYNSSLNDKFKLSDLLFTGKSRPAYAGSFSNTISWKGLSLYFNMTYKLGYYFRRSSINYSQLIGNWQNGNKDFALRWQKPGDEINTQVPSFIYPDASNGNRDRYYNQSTILIEKADQVRLQFINLNYTVNSKVLKGLPISSLRVYFYANNLGIIWRANNRNIDPDNPNGIPSPKTYSFGIYAGF
jgi:hypothetical protein